MKNRFPKQVHYNFLGTNNLDIATELHFFLDIIHLHFQHLKMLNIIVICAASQVKLLVQPSSFERHWTILTLAAVTCLLVDFLRKRSSHVLILGLFAILYLIQPCSSTCMSAKNYHSYYGSEQSWSIINAGEDYFIAGRANSVDSFVCRLDHYLNTKWCSIISCTRVRGLLYYSTGDRVYVAGMSAYKDGSCSSTGDFTQNDIFVRSYYGSSGNTVGTWKLTVGNLATSYRLFIVDTAHGTLMGSDYGIADLSTSNLQLVSGITVSTLFSLAGDGNFIYACGYFSDHPSTVAVKAFWLSSIGSGQDYTILLSNTYGDYFYNNPMIVLKDHKIAYAGSSSDYQIAFAVFTPAAASIACSSYSYCGGHDCHATGLAQLATDNILLVATDCQSIAQVSCAMIFSSTGSPITNFHIGDGYVSFTGIAPLAEEESFIAVAAYGSTSLIYSLNCVCKVGYYQAATCSQCTDTHTTVQLYYKCEYCPAGKYQPQAQQTSCISCDPGTYNGADAATGCTTCSAGSYSGLGSSTCHSCNAGQYSLASSSTCLSACPAGSYKPALCS